MSDRINGHDGLLSVEAALAAVIASAGAPLPGVMVPLSDALGRTLAADLTARRTQPPFACSSMDGYAVRVAELAVHGVRLRLIGESAAGHAFDRVLKAGEAVRIFTGAALPAGADTIIRQEDTVRHTGDEVSFSLSAAPAPGRFVRPQGLDFTTGDTLLRAGQRLDARRLALAAAMDHAEVCVHRAPRVAILATGDELVMPGQGSAPEAVVASNTFAIAAMVRGCGGEVADLGIVPDRLEMIAGRISAAREAGIDVLVTLGGASVGDHDLTKAALDANGFDPGFWRIAMRPGKPLIHGRIDQTIVLGLPGNPVSAIVCGLIFLQPLLRAMSGDPAAAADQTTACCLAEGLPANDDRQDYVRATIVGEQNGLPLVRPLARQDSAMIAALVTADALILRPPHAAPAKAGDICQALILPS